MLKNNKILIIVLLALIIAAAGFWYFYRNGGDNWDKISFITGFVLLDDEADLIWSRPAADLSDESRAVYQARVEAIKADLTTATDKDRRLDDYNDLAIYQNYLGNYRESYDAYLKSLSLESGARVTWQNFADALLKMKAFKSAEMAYKRAIELNKYIPQSYVKLADYYQAMGDDAQVETTYKIAVEAIAQSYESDELVLDAYAEWLILKGRDEEAIKILQELIIKQPDNKEAIERKIKGMGK